MRPAWFSARSFKRRAFRLRRPPRTFVVSRSTMLIATATMTLLVVWGGASAWYFVQRDEVALKLLEKQASLQRSYEQKIGHLRTKLDEVSSQRLVERERMETHLRDLLARQREIEARHLALQTLADRSGLAGTTVVERSSALPTATSPRMSAPPPPPEEFQLRLRDAFGPERTSDLSPLEEGLRRAAQTLSHLDAAQIQVLGTLVRVADARSISLANAIAMAGLDAKAFDVASPGGKGGPFVPITQTSSTEFSTLVARAQASIERLYKLQQSALALPFREPIVGELDLTSGFGHRPDPFTRALAMHTGLDFKAEHGAPVRASGGGQVVAAEYSGAYGNMVEIDHGNGVSSRYAHLASIEVAVGQRVAAGAVLGRVGSTGRSTGPHLHYETRINGDAVDPQRFLRAGALIAQQTVASR